MSATHEDVEDFLEANPELEEKLQLWKTMQHRFSGTKPDLMKDIVSFHVKFGRFPSDDSVHPDPKLALFRLKFLREELDEFQAALEVGDMVKAADAIVDIVYVALGTAYLFDMDFNTLWTEVHSTNMAKAAATSNRPGSRGFPEFDIVKPPGWKGPELFSILKNHYCQFGSNERHQQVDGALTGHSRRVKFAEKFLELLREDLAKEVKPE